jgi:voltage-gated potassium channel
MSEEKHSQEKETLRQKLYIIIFEANTKMGKAFDVILLVVILSSIIIVMLESVDYINIKYSQLFFVLEWIFTILFTIEYIARIIISPNPRKYIFSFFGIIDLLSILPAYISLVVAGYHSLIIFRSFRLLRVFRIFKLVRFVGEASTLSRALAASRAKIIVFITAVAIIVVIMGTIMYIVEGAENGFTSIPRSIYWAIVTLTTVGYGDIAPGTVLGQALASIIMILGYAIIAVPTGIVTTEMAKAQIISKTPTNTITCSNCGAQNHDEDADYCKICGAELE